MHYKVHEGYQGDVDRGDLHVLGYTSLDYDMWIPRGLLMVMCSPLEVVQYGGCLSRIEVCFFVYHKCRVCCR